MQKISTLCIYCSASNSVDEKYKQLACDAGAFCAGQKLHVVYGGGRVGLMGAVADAALSNGAQVTGVIPQYLVDREVAHQGLTQLHITTTIQERQSMMAALSDAFLILPGGLGTLAEFFEVITWKQLGLHAKPIILLNGFAYWNPLIEMLERAAAENFLHHVDDQMLRIVEDLNEVAPLLGLRNYS
jgi:uncharacterized protein (TIGR00730 family)